jgi:hypothetical protein
VISGGLFDKDHWIDRRQHREEVLQKLENFLKKRDKDSLVELVKSLWASGVWTSAERAVEEKITGRGFAIEDVARKLELVKSDPIKLLKEDIPGFGPASITEIMFCADPEKFPIFNKRAKISLKTLGYGDFEKVQRLTVSVYQDFTKALERMYMDFKVLKDKIEERVGFSIPKFDFVDNILNLLYEGELSVDEIKELRRQALLEEKIDEAIMNYALGSIQGAVKQYFHWLGKGDSEEKAIEKAANYAVGMITASGIFSDPKKRQAFATVLEAMARLAKRIAELLRELP